MNMRYFRKQMMFDLEIQSPNQPGNQPVVGGEIGCCIHLVNGPFIFNFIGIHISNRER